ncbi:MAG TPA: ATP-dependent Clp protease adaptor ClpS [bacterium]|nr:ATP-dependent Clp protease adaptor ClpS [bacterium]HMW33009.1 ATP-dependent Clp protease adaptor ClpS [bacterium]HMW36680.1 ATP-dependent Clp protease adaptor ClpS [bacterium]HMY36272.1 ATP-dependent Clp protease adaptor ClpS [bacterium]HMZ04746.1 ATP-dependent Clp protease adaptor ClpS [bacterium]
MKPITAIATQTEHEVSESTTLDHPLRVILFNDDIHTFDEVIAQVIKAIGCTVQKAEAIAWEVHTRGKAVVYEGDLGECLRVSSVLEEIGLHTQIEP